MQERQTRKTRVSTTCVLVSLIVAVFAFGLSARIQWVRTGASLMQAKLSVEKPSATVFAAPSAETDSPVPAEVFYELLGSLLLALVSQAAFRSLRLDWKLRESTSLDAQGPSVMFRPPPFEI